MVFKHCDKSSSSTLQASTTASKRMHAVRFFLERDIVGSASCRRRHFKHVRTVKKGGMQNEAVKLNKWNYFCSFCL